MENFTGKEIDKEVENVLENFWKVEMKREGLFRDEFEKNLDEICQMYHKKTNACFIDFDTYTASKLRLKSNEIVVYYTTDDGEKICHYATIIGISLGRDGKFRAAHCRIDGEKNKFLTEELYKNKFIHCTSVRMDWLVENIMRAMLGDEEYAKYEDIVYKI